MLVLIDATPEGKSFINAGGATCILLLASFGPVGSQ
jgi:hypothetical protein